MYIIWSIINLPLAIKYYKDKEISYVIQRIFLVGSYRQFWFLWALLIDIPIVYFLNKKISPKLTMLIGSVLYLIGTVGLEFYKVVMELSVLSIFYKCIFDFFITTRNAIFLGFVFVAIGNYFANCKNNLTIIKVYTVFVLTSITIFLENIVFTKFSYKNLGDMRISLLPLVFCLFYLVSHIDLKNRKIYILLRNMSMYIYCSHCILAEGINLIFKVNLTLGQQYICGVVFSILFSYMMVKIKQIQKNKLVTNKI